jgi:hypothetical protein
MTFYSLVLFVHVTAVLGLWAALSVEGLALFHLTRASTITEARRWIATVAGLPLVAAGSLLFIFLSGIYLAMRMSAFELAWPKVTVGALLLIAPLGAVTGRRMRAIRQACADGNAVNSELARRLRDPFLRISLAVRITVFLGILMLMAAKPDVWQSVSIVGISVVLGFLLSLLAWYRTRPLPAPSADLGG